MSLAPAHAGGFFLTLKSKETYYGDGYRKAALPPRHLTPRIKDPRPTATRKETGRGVRPVSEGPRLFGRLFGVLRLVFVQVSARDFRARYLFM